MPQFAELHEKPTSLSQRAMSMIRKMAKTVGAGEGKLFWMITECAVKGIERSSSGHWPATVPTP